MEGIRKKTQAAGWANNALKVNEITGEQLENAVGGEYDPDTISGASITVPPDYDYPWLNNRK